MKYKTKVSDTKDPFGIGNEKKVEYLSSDDEDFFE